MEPESLPDARRAPLGLGHDELGQLSPEPQPAGRHARPPSGAHRRPSELHRQDGAVRMYGGRLTRIPLDASLTGRRLVLPETLVPEIARLLSSYRDGEAHEGVVYLGGVETSEQSVALLAIAPVATTTPGSFRTGLGANAAVV